MKFATGLVFAALAVTAANAGNSKNLRTQMPESASDDFDFSDSLDASGSDDFIDDDDLTIDLTDLFGSDSTDGSHVKINIMSLIGSGSDQVDLQDIIDAFDEESNDASGSDDLSWLFDSDSGSDDEDPILVKGKDPIAPKGKGLYADDSGDEDPILVKGSSKTTATKSSKTPIYDDSESGSDDLSWLLDSDSDSGNDEDPILVKGKDPIATKGKGLYADDSGDEDPILVKGSSKTTATKSSKSSKSTKTGTETSSIGDLYEDGSEGVIGDESEEDDPILVKGATKSGKKSAAVEEDASDEDDHLQSQQTSEGEKTATKSSKTTLY